MLFNCVLVATSLPSLMWIKEQLFSLLTEGKNRNTMKLLQSHINSKTPFRFPVSIPTVLTFDTQLHLIFQAAAFSTAQCEQLRC